MNSAVEMKCKEIIRPTTPLQKICKQQKNTLSFMFRSILFYSKCIGKHQFSTALPETNFR